MRFKAKADTFVVSAKDLRTKLLDILIDHREGYIDINEAADALEEIVNKEKSDE